MKFSEAFKMMKQGMKVKLPSWGGYWYWDQEKETIMIQCRPQDGDQGELLDIPLLITVIRVNMKPQQQHQVGLVTARVDIITE